MPIFFVPPLDEVKHLLEAQFLLVYHGKFSWIDTEHLTPIERNFMLDRLISERNKENEQAKEAAASVKTPRSSSKSKR